MGGVGGEEKSPADESSFSVNSLILVLVKCSHSRAPPLARRLKAMETKNMEDLNSGSFKGFGRSARDTRNNWLQFMFVTHKRYNCFRKQSTINSCTSGFKELEAFGFEFGEIGFGGTHVHFDANVPKKYSVMVAEIMLKSRSAKRIFAEHPGFRKRYPDGRF